MKRAVLVMSVIVLFLFSNLALAEFSNRRIGKGAQYLAKKTTDPEIKNKALHLASLTMIAEEPRAAINSFIDVLIEASKVEDNSSTDAFPTFLEEDTRKSKEFLTLLSRGSFNEASKLYKSIIENALKSDKYSEYDSDKKKEILDNSDLLLRNIGVFAFSNIIAYTSKPTEVKDLANVLIKNPADFEKLAKIFDISDEDFSSFGPLAKMFAGKAWLSLGNLDISKQFLVSMRDQTAKSGDSDAYSNLATDGILMLYWPEESDKSFELAKDLAGKLSEDEKATALALIDALLNTRELFLLGRPIGSLKIGANVMVSSQVDYSGSKKDPVKIALARKIAQKYSGAIDINNLATFALASSSAVACYYMGLVDESENLIKKLDEATLQIQDNQEKFAFRTITLAAAHGSQSKEFEPILKSIVSSIFDGSVSQIEKGNNLATVLSAISTIEPTQPILQISPSVVEWIANKVKAEINEQDALAIAYASLSIVKSPKQGEYQSFVTDFVNKASKEKDTERLSTLSALYLILLPYDDRRSEQIAESFFQF